MQLTRLDIKGFKSFGDKTTIHFNDGVTAIVGPNGCGKSNVVDAIRWVLGEQSTKNLRSEKMENVIFNGTKNRKPAQLAEVSLSFDNKNNVLPTSFSQVTVTRKLYRSGESEYRLNDVQCRLKDITDLFLDTGIGSDSYAIIELKMVDEIINNKENSRRTLFEEASGISKYKARKKQTFARLKETEQDLNRIDDLLYEIEKNLKSLEYQAKKTERYYKLKEIYKSASIALASIRLTALTHEINQLQKKEALEQESQRAINTAITDIEFTIRKLKSDLLVEEKNLSTQQKTLNLQNSKIQAYESEKKVKNEQLRHLNEKSEHLNKELIQDRQQFNHIQYSLSRIREELFEEREKVDELEKEVGSRFSEVDTLHTHQKKLKTELDEYIRQKDSAQGMLYNLEKAIAVLIIQLDALNKESSRNLSDNNTREQELSMFDKAVSELEIKLEALQNDYDFYLEEEAALENQLKSCQDKIEYLKAQQIQETRILDARQNEYSLTKSLVDNLEGFPESIRFLKKNSAWKVDAPLLSDVLYCNENYRIAIENFLDSYMNYYIVEDINDALKAIQLLSDTGKGKAGFFVLNLINDDPAQVPAPNDHLIPALTVIDVEEKYIPLCKHLLKNVFFERNSGDFFRNQELPEKEVVLDKEGRFIKKIGSISGGSIGLFEGKRIGRAKNLANLQVEINKLTKSLSSLESELSSEVYTLESLKSTTRKSQIQEINLQINQLTNELISVQTKREQYQHFIEHNKSKKESIDQKTVELEGELELKKQALETERNNLHLIEDNLAYLQQDYTKSAELYAEQSAVYNQKNILYHQQKNKVSSLEKDLEYREIQLENIENRIQKHELEIKNTQDALKDIVLHVDLSDDDLKNMYEERNSLLEGLSGVEKNYYTLRKEINDLEEKLHSIRKNKEQSDYILAELKAKATEVNLNLHTLQERTLIEFNLEAEELNELSYPNEDEQELRERVGKYKKQLDDFGTINPLAMESFKEMNERYSFIKKEKEDLLEAKDALLKTIKEIDDTAQAKFLNAFNSVRNNFIEVFRSLFSHEDTCDILLTNPQNPLDSDIQIIAKPKGKKPLSINQLSGGEKTLTATALLFSLYLLKPAPFCIFDEVDAPLDDTNIDKFNNIIRKFSDRSQFIIVSHNKRTIASTDVIYGVTMVEQGISRLVAVDLQNLVVNSN